MLRPRCDCVSELVGWAEACASANGVQLLPYLQPGFRPTSVHPPRNNSYVPGDKAVNPYGVSRAALDLPALPCVGCDIEGSVSDMAMAKAKAKRTVTIPACRRCVRCGLTTPRSEM